MSESLVAIAEGPLQHQQNIRAAIITCEQAAELGETLAYLAERLRICGTAALQAPITLYCVAL